MGNGNEWGIKNVLQFLLIFAHNQSSQSGYPGMATTILHSKVPRMRQNQIQHMKLHHFSYITLLKLQRILSSIHRNGDEWG